MRSSSSVLLTASKRILEDLLETQELQNAEVDTWVEAQTALVGTKSAVELHTETAVDLTLALVVLPGNTELDDALGDGGDLESLAVLGVLLEEGGVLQGRGKLCETAVSLAEELGAWCGSDDLPL